MQASSAHRSWQISSLWELHIGTFRAFDHLSDDLADDLKSFYAHLEPRLHLLYDARHVSKPAAGHPDNKCHRPSGHDDPLLSRGRTSGRERLQSVTDALP